MAKKQGYSIQIINTIYDTVPAFTDLFDEETWYIFVTFLVVGSVAVAFIISRYVTIRAVE